MPEISADGRVWTIRVKPGIYFADDPAFKGKKRELVAAGLRLCVEAAARPEGALADAAGTCRRQARRRRRRASPRRSATGRFDYDAPIAGPEGASTATRSAIELRSPTTSCMGYLYAVADGRGRARGDRRVRRRERLGDGESGRHRAVPAEGVAARRRRSCSRRIRVTATSTFPARRPRRSRARRDDEGQAAAADRARRDLDHRGVEPAAARVRHRRARLRRTCRPISSATCSTPSNTLKPAYAERGRARRTAWCSRRCRTPTSTWTIRSSAATRRTRSRCAARSSWAFNTPELDHGRGGRARRSPATQPIPPGVPGHDDGLDVRAPYDPATARGAARQVRLRRPRRRRLARPAGRQAADPRDGVARRRAATASATSCGRRA